MRITISDDTFIYGDKQLGPTSALLVDPHEFTDLTEEDGVVHCTLPARADLVFAVENYVVVAEMKRTGDLISSIRSRRFARQLTSALEMGDIVALVWRDWRGPVNVWDGADELRLIERELVKLQALGIYFLPVPADARAIVATLGYYRNILNPLSRTALSVIRGTEKPKIKGTILNAVPGLGTQRVTRLLNRFGSARRVFTASEKELYSAGLTTAVIKNMNRVLDSNPLDSQSK